MRFAAFIMTYERPGLLIQTVDKILAQTVSPEKILVVDNSPSDETRECIARKNDRRVEYLRMGYNAGPAGAARAGLQRLCAEGYDWIHWADDDDPPKLNDAFEKLLAHVGPEIGVIGAVGSMFDWKTGLRKRYKDNDLNGVLEVDSIGGGYCMIINAKAITNDTLPDERLFFGLEEFDFCQRVKRAGYQICVLGELMYRYREINNKLGLEKKPALISKRNINQLHREYYSYRNAIFLMRNTYQSNRLVFRYIMRALGKIVFGFLKGFKFGIKNTEMLGKAIVHGLSGKMGKLT